MKQLKAFVSGNVSFRLFYQSKASLQQLPEAFKDHAAPPIDGIGVAPVCGWTEGMRTMGTEFKDEYCVSGRYVCAALVQAERKIPAVLLDVKCQAEYEVEKQARGVEHLPKMVRSEIKERISEQLKPSMPPSISGITVVADREEGRVFASCMSDAQIDALSNYINIALEQRPVLMTPETAAITAGINPAELECCSFSPDLSVEPPAESSLGMDFLTWLWFNWDVNGAVQEVGGHDLFSYMLAGPVSFYREGEGAHEALLRKGAPLGCREAAAALMAGKKIKKVKFVLAHGDKVFSATVDDSFAFRSVKLPKIEAFGCGGLFAERMRLLQLFVNDWFLLYNRFLSLRGAGGTWMMSVEQMRTWITRMSEK